MSNLYIISRSNNNSVTKKVEYLSNNWQIAQHKYERVCPITKFNIRTYIFGLANSKCIRQTDTKRTGRDRLLTN